MKSETRHIPVLMDQVLGTLSPSVLPCKTIKDRVVIEDLHASMYRAVGISPRLSYDIESRPFYTTKDGKGKCIDALVA